MAIADEPMGTAESVAEQPIPVGKRSIRQRPPRAEPSDQLGSRSLSDGCHFWVVLHLMRRMRPHYDRALAHVALGAMQYNLLSQIEKLGPVSHRVLAASMALDPSTLGRNLRTLLAQQWVEVRPGADPRTKLVSLTQAGKAKLADGHAQWQLVNEQVGTLLGADLTADLHGVADRCLPRLGTAPAAGTVGPSRRRP